MTRKNSSSRTEIAAHNFERGTAAEIDLDDERSRFQFIVNASHDLISFVDINYVYQAVNAAYQRVYGWEAEAIIGRHVADVWGQEKFEEILKPKFDRCFAGEEVCDQSWIDCGNAGMRYMDITYHPYRGSNGRVMGAGVTSHDITELKLAEEALREREMRLRVIFETSPDWIVSTDADGDYVFLNPSAQNVFKEKKNYLIFIHKEDLERTKSAWDALMAGEEVRDFENRVIGRDGAIYYVGWNASPLRTADGKVAGCIAIGRDLGAKRKLEQVVAENALTAREAEVFRLVIQGDTNLNIAAKLGIGEATVKSHLNSMFKKLTVHNRTELSAIIR